MEIQIKPDGRPINVVGPPFIFSWFNNLRVVAEKQNNTFIVLRTEIVEKMRKKDSPHGDLFADFFNDSKNYFNYSEEVSVIENFIFDSDSVIEIN